MTHSHRMEYWTLPDFQRIVGGKSKLLQVADFLASPYAANFANFGPTTRRVQECYRRYAPAGSSYNPNTPLVPLTYAEGVQPLQGSGFSRDVLEAYNNEVQEEAENGDWGAEGWTLFDRIYGAMRAEYPDDSDLTFMAESVSPAYRSQAPPNQRATLLRSALNTLSKAIEKQMGLSGGIRAPLCRVGNKNAYTPLLNAIMPPHTTYVEPFAGSLGWFFNKPKVEREAINDLDKELISFYRDLQTASTDQDKYPSGLTTIPKLQAFYNNPARSKEQRIIKSIVRTCNGYMGQPIGTSGKKATVFRPVNPGSKVKHIDEYKERLKGVHIYNDDYAKVIKQYDGPNTFIFMDPPYEDSDRFGYAQEGDFDFERFAKIVKGIKGKFLVTINDSPRVRELFSWAHLYPITIKGFRRKASSKGGIGTKDRGELIITNYELPRNWRSNKFSRML